MSNPFELRFKILEMAKDYLDKSYQLQVDMAKQSMDALEKQGKLNQEVMKSMIPTKYTMQDVLEKASELYGFVESKKK